MEIIVAGDSRYCPWQLETLEKQYPDAELYIHAGPIAQSGKDWIEVKGPGACTIEILGHKLYVTGSSIQSVQTLVQRARILGCDVAIWGGVPVTWCVELDGIWLVNPGSLFHSANALPPSYAILTLHKGKEPECAFRYKPDW